MRVKFKVKMFEGVKFLYRFTPSPHIDDLVYVEIVNYETGQTAFTSCANKNKRSKRAELMQGCIKR